MRAYLSDIHNVQGSDPNTPKYGFLDGGAVSVADFLGDVAEREARAILSETEPESRHSSTFAPAPYYQPWGSRSERSRMLSALAESLAAFVRG